MTNPILSRLANTWKRLSNPQADDLAIATLGAFVKDNEHEMASVVTALQAHIDLIHDEQIRNNMPVDRFAIVDRLITRLISNTNILASVAAQAQRSVATQKLSLDQVLFQIIEDSSEQFKLGRINVHCDIAKGLVLVCNAVALNAMVKGVISSVIDQCHEQETVMIVAGEHKRVVSVSVEIGMDASVEEFKPWDLGRLRLIPTNGQGITLSGVEAMARLNRGHLTVRNALDRRQGYKLIFQT